ncbi:hypothetical protein D9756_005185 [Leucocoprinus leucothites]|uniref:Uncharacterized protein n=1 Tax=Leucocoprinus leucothites TaxID=201217 RepID=A0A8H5G8M1_9AGAR|nr:hypothetical protein D9756_005185 [Leucoagaricus leucothites]
MVKRPKSPEPVEDSKFLTVVHPFPLNANMEVPNDYKEFMFWLASVVGKDYALGVHHKPSARGMVVAEVSKSFEDFDKLLGEHSWNRFLRKCSTEESERKTRVYYSTYSNARALQKDGWKNVLADDALFHEFRAINNKIQHPYPIPVWCDVPPEDPTNKRICRPLPALTKAPPPRPPVLVPGSSNWSSQKTGGKGARQPPPIEQKGGPSKKGGGKSPINPDAWKTPIISPAVSRASSTPISTSSTSPSVISSKSAWSRALASDGTAASTPRSVSPASAVASSEVSIPASSPSSISRVYTSPPGLPAPSSASSQVGKPTNPVGSSSISMLHSQFAGTSISGSATSSVIGSPSEGDPQFDEDDDEEDFAFPLASKVSASDDFRSAVGEEPRMGKGPGKGKFSQGNVANSSRSSKQDYSDNNFSKVPQTTSRTFRKVIPEDELCPLHGVVCSPGICSVMKKRKREKEWAANKSKKEKKKSRRKPQGGDDEEKDEEKADGKDSDDDSANSDSTVGEANANRKGSLVESRSKALASVASSTKRSISVSSGRSSTAPSVAGSNISAIKGDWGPKRKRNARGRAQDHGPSESIVDSHNATFDPSDALSDRLESIAASSARPTYGGEGSTITTNSVIFSQADYDYDDDDDNDYDFDIRSTADSVNTVSAYSTSSSYSTPYSSAPYSSAAGSGSTMKPTPPTRSNASFASAAASVSSSSYSSYSTRSNTNGWISGAATAASSSYAGSVSGASVRSNGSSGKPASAKGDLKGKGKANAPSENGKGKGSVQASNGKNTPTPRNPNPNRKKTWVEMVDEDDGSDLGSVMQI